MVPSIGRPISPTRPRALVNWGVYYRCWGLFVIKIIDWASPPPGALAKGSHPLIIVNKRVYGGLAVIPIRAKRRKNKKDWKNHHTWLDSLVVFTMALGLHAREPGPIEFDFDRVLVLSL